MCGHDAGPWMSHSWVSRATISAGGALGWQHPTQVRRLTPRRIVATRTSIHDVIERFRDEPSTARRGAQFEQLMVSYFETDPTLASEYDLSLIHI